MSGINQISSEIIRAATALQVAVYEYLDSSLEDRIAMSNIEKIVKTIAAHVKQLKKEDEG